MVTLDEMLTLGGPRSGSRNLKAKALATKEDIHYASIGDCGEALLLLDIV